MIYTFTILVAIAAFALGHMFGFTAGRKKLTFEHIKEGETKSITVTMTNMTPEEERGLREIFGIHKETP